MAALPQRRIQLKAGVFWFVLVSVTSWIVLRFLDKKIDPRRSSQELNTETPCHRNRILAKLRFNEKKEGEPTRLAFFDG